MIPARHQSTQYGVDNPPPPPPPPHRCYIPNLNFSECLHTEYNTQIQYTTGRYLTPFMDSMRYMKVIRHVQSYDAPVCTDIPPGFTELCRREKGCKETTLDQCVQYHPLRYPLRHAPFLPKKFRLTTVQYH